jgi:translation initiation factor 5B
LNEDEFMALDEILEIKRRRDPDWGKFGLFEY